MKKIIAMLALTAFSFSSISNSNASVLFANFQHLTKSGKPDKRYNDSKHLKKDGTTDMRFKESKKAAAKKKKS